MYVGNRYFTFRLGHTGFWRAYARYLAVGLLVAAVNAALLSALVESTGIDPRAGQAVSLLMLATVRLRPLQAMDVQTRARIGGVDTPRATKFAVVATLAVTAGALAFFVEAGPEQPAPSWWR